MLVAILIIIVLIFIAGIFIERIGLVLALILAFIGKPFVMLERVAARAKLECWKATRTALKLHKDEEEGAWIGLGVISRIVYFFLSIAVIIGELANILLIIPVMTGEKGMQLPISFDLATAFVWFCPPALFGCLFLESVGIIPENVRLFSRLGNITRIIFAVVSIALLVFSILIIALFFKYRAIVLSGDIDTANSLLEPIFIGLGVLVSTSLVIAVWAIISGFASIISVLCVIGSGICALAELVCSLDSRLIEFLCFFLSRRKISPYMDIDKPGALQQTSYQFDEKQLGFSNSQPQQLEGIEMSSDPFQNGLLGLIGSEASYARPYVYQTIKQAGADREICAAFYLDLSREAENIPHPSARIVNLDPSSSEKHFVTISGKGEEKAYSDLLKSIANKAIEVLLHSKGTPGVIVLFIDNRLTNSAIPMVKIFKNRLPGHSIMLVTSVSSGDLDDTYVQQGFKSILSLWQDGTIDGCLLIDKNSAIVQNYSEETQYMIISNTIVSLYVAHKHHHHNPTPREVLTVMRRTSCFFGLASASAPIAAYRVSLIRKVFRKFFMRNAWLGDVSDASDQARNVINEILTDENTRLFNEPVSQQRNKFILVSAPFEANRAFLKFAETIRSYISSRQAGSIVVQANGIAYPNQIVGGFLVQATALYPLLTPVMSLTAIESKSPALIATNTENAEKEPGGDKNAEVEQISHTSPQKEANVAEKEDKPELAPLAVEDEGENDSTSRNGHQEQPKRKRGRPGKKEESK